MRKSKSEREAERRESVAGLRADMKAMQTVYVKRSDANVRVIRLFRVEVNKRPTGRTTGRTVVVCGDGAVLVEITADVRRALGLRATRNGLAIPGGGSNPCHDTVCDLAHALGFSGLRCEEV